jgi:hypothetical protein
MAPASRYEEILGFKNIWPLLGGCHVQIGLFLVARLNFYVKLNLFFTAEKRPLKIILFLLVKCRLWKLRYYFQQQAATHPN